MLTLGFIIPWGKWINIFNMIIMKLSGGLGNQFFQYATLRALGIQNRSPIGINVGSYLGNKNDSINRRVCHLQDFNTEMFNVGNSEIKKTLLITGNKFIDDYFLLKIKFMQKNAIYDNFDLRNVKNKNACLIGTFVNPAFFSKIKKNLIEELRLKNTNKIKNLLRQIKKTNSVSIHVRRGDLLKIRNGYSLTEDYYKKAISMIIKRIKTPHFFIFSDDICWCKKSFSSLPNATFLEGNSVSEDLELMKTCKHNIIANSTLSWWAAYLNENKKKIIVQPKHMGSFKNDMGENLIFSRSIKI